MIKLHEVEKQLKAIGANNRFWGRPERLELQHILIPGEKIQSCLNGRYEGGIATFVATDQRLLLVDKKLFFLTVEDMRYDMIAEVDFSGQLLTGTLSVCTPTKTMAFTTLKPAKLRKLATYIQGRVMDIRQDYGLHQSKPESNAQAAQAQQGYFRPDPHQPQLEPASEAAASQEEPAQPAHSGMVEVTELPVPRRRNPYMGAPLMTRRRIGRFGPISAHPEDIEEKKKNPQLLWARR